MLLYRIIRFLTFPLYWLALKIKSKENHARFHEKLGHPTEDRPKGDVIWVHCHDFDESDDIVRNIQSVMPNWTILLTYNNCGVRNYYGAGVICQSAPVDAYLSVRNFLRFWEPSLAVRIGSELRPNQLFALKKMNVPNFLVNGEISDKSYWRWKWARGTARKITRNFTFVWALDNKQTLRLANLGAANIENQELIAGNNKVKEILQKIKRQVKP